MKVLVLGADGLLGHNVVSELSSCGVQTIAAIRRPEPSLVRLRFFRDSRIVSGVDLAAANACTGLLAATQPDCVVNCAGIVKQRSADESVMEAVNARMPAALAVECAARNVRLVHVSTDCVFSGSRGAYTESDAPDPSDAYGRSKERGERGAAGALILRTSFVGRELSRRVSLLEWCLARNGETIDGYSNAFFSGLSAPVAAREIRRIVCELPELRGIHHLAGPRISKLELLRLVRDVFSLSIEIVPSGSFACDRSLLGEKYRKATGFAPPSWGEMLEELAEKDAAYGELAAVRDEARVP